MLRGCRVSCVHPSLSFCCCCRSQRKLRQRTSGQNTTGTATVSSPVTSSRRTTASRRLMPGKMRRRASRSATGASGISTPCPAISAGMATGTISAGPAFTAAVTMAAPLARAGRGPRSVRCGIAGDAAVAQRSVDRSDGLRCCLGKFRCVKSDSDPDFLWTMPCALGSPETRWTTLSQARPAG